MYSRKILDHAGPGQMVMSSLIMLNVEACTGDCPITKDIETPFAVFEGSERGESEVALEFGKWKGG